MKSSERYIRGLEFMNKEDYDRAIEEFKAALKIQPDYPIAKNKLYWSYCDRAKTYLREKKEIDSAIADYGRAISLDPSRAAAYNNRGIAYDIKGDGAKAIADWEAVLKIEPDNATTKELLVMAQKAQ